MLEGEPHFDGDLAVTYTRALRDIEAHADARDVMDILARAEGCIPAEMLAEATSESAVEQALQAASHLLEREANGWRVFHNSFRLFLLDRPKLRFGRPDPEHGQRIYRRLASLAASHVGKSPQRWLELRYLARAGCNDQVIELARPRRLREQLAEGRPIGDLFLDVRLAFAGLCPSDDGAALFQLMLMQDELERRTTALENAPALAEAYLAVGDIPSAIRQASAGPGGYKVIAALMLCGEVERARQLFDRIEPLSGPDRLADTSSLRHEEAAAWAEVVHLFREPDQIREAIDRLTQDAGPFAGDDRDLLNRRLRMAVALAALADAPRTDPAELGNAMQLDDADMAYLLAQAALSAERATPESVRVATFVRALSHPGFQRLDASWRRNLAAAALRNGDLASARTAFDGVPTPTLERLRDGIGDDHARSVIRSVIDHAWLATSLGAGPENPASNARLALAFFVRHAQATGALLARARAGLIAVGEVARATCAALTFLEGVKPRGSEEFYAMHQIAAGAPEMLAALMEAALAVGRDEFDRVVAEIDAACGRVGSRNEGRLNLRREAAVLLYTLAGDAEGAARRLRQLEASVRADTPEAQIEEMALLAAALASVGALEDARAILERVNSHTLGNALAAKKDPQYVMWIELFGRANAADPAGSRERVATLARVMSGMANTEGEGSARRIASDVLAQASYVDARTGSAVGQAFLRDSLLSWGDAVNAALLGIVRRRADVAEAAVAAWASLCLPFYAEPHYRQSRLGEFVTDVVAVIDESTLGGTVDLLRDAIASESVHDSRTGLLDCLVRAARLRGVGVREAEAQLDRWMEEEAERPAASTPGRYDNVRDLAELGNRMTADAALAELPYEASAAFAKFVAGGAQLDEAAATFAAWSELQRDTRARFALVDRAVSAGDLKLVRQLVEDYPRYADREDTWTHWLGGGRKDHFRNLVILDGDVVRAAAFSDSPRRWQRHGKAPAT